MLIVQIWGELDSWKLLSKTVERFDFSVVRSEWRKRGTANYEDGTNMSIAKDERSNPDTMGVATTETPSSER
jgi:hypothetical protein